MNKPYSTTQGFTLIELLVVISIISLLSSIVLTSLVEVRERAEITQFVSQFNQIRDAIQKYENDNGSLPFTPATVTNSAVYEATVSTLVSEGYISEAPDLDRMREVFGMRTSDPRLGLVGGNVGYCLGDENPPRYAIYFRNDGGPQNNPDQGEGIYDNVLPRLYRTNGSGVFNSGAFAIYCLFVPHS